MPNQLQDYLNYVEADKQRKEKEDSLLEYNNFLQDETLQPEDRTVTGYDEIISTNQPSSYSPNVSTSGKKTLTQLENDPKFAKIANRFLESIGENDDIFEYLRDSDYSLSAAAVRAVQTNSWTEEQAADYVYLRDQFANTELSGFKERFNFVKDFTVDALTDPLNIVAAIFAGPTLGASFAARGALSIAAKEGVKRNARQTAKRKALRKAKVGKAAKAGAKIGAAEGALWAGPHEYFLQDIDIDLGARDEIDLGIIAGTTALGGILGGSIGGGLAGVSAIKNSKYLNDKTYKYTNENEIDTAGNAQTRQEVLEDSRFDRARIKAGEVLNRINPLKKKGEDIAENSKDALYLFLGNSFGKPTTQFLNKLKDSETLNDLLGRFRYDFDSTLGSKGRKGPKEKSYGLLLQEYQGLFVGGLQQATKKLDRMGIKNFLGLRTGNKLENNVNDQLAMMLRDEKLTVNNAENLRNSTYKGQFKVNDDVLDAYIDIKTLLNEGYTKGKESGLFLDSTGYTAGYLPRLFNYSYLMKNRDRFEQLLIKAGHATPNNKKTPIKTFDDAGREIKDDVERFAKGDQGVDRNTFGRDFEAEANALNDGTMSDFEVIELSQQMKAKQIVDDMLEYKSTPFELKSANQTGSSTGFIQSRRFQNLDDNEIADFLENDVELILEDYFTNLSQGIARTEKFGKSLADFDKNFIDPIRTELITASTKRGMGKEEAIAEADLVADRLRHMHKRVTGIETPRIKNKKASIANDAFKLSQQLAHLPFVTLSSITEPFILYSRAGIKDAPQVTIDIFKSIGKEVGNNVDKVVRSIKRMQGKTTKNTDSFTGLKELDDADWKELYQTGLGLEQAVQERLAGLVGESMDNSLIKNISNGFFKATFLSQWTKSVQLAAFTTGKRLIKQRAEALYQHQSGKKLIKLTGDSKTSTTKYYREQLNDLGIDEKEAIEWYKKSLDSNGNFNQTLAESQDFYMDKLTSGANRFSKEIILNPSTAEANRPLWFSNPSAQLLVQFAGYPTVFSNTILKRYANESWNNPTQVMPKVAMTTLVMGTIAHLGNTLRSQGENLYDYETGERKDGTELVIESIRRFGGLGPLDYAYKYDQDKDRNVGQVAAVLKTFAGPLPQDGMDAFLFRRGFAEVLAQNVPFYQALPSETRKAMRKYGRELDKGKKIDDNKKDKRVYYYAKGGLVYNVPNVTNEPDEMKSRITKQPFNATSEAAQDIEDRELKSQMEGLGLK